MLPPIELRQLKSFVALAEELHFARAAARVHVSRPALSEQMRRLEAALQIRLFERTTRAVQLTAAGEAFLPQARLVLAQVELSVRSIEKYQGGERVE